MEEGEVKAEIEESARGNLNEVKIFLRPSPFPYLSLVLLPLYPYAHVRYNDEFRILS